MTTRYARVAGARLEDLGHEWAAFSPLSGATHLLNDSSAAMLQLLAERSDASTEELAVVIAAETGDALAAVAPVLAAHWDTLVEAGLVRVIAAR
jgi:PqqD family protein of HPr-rel-A system